MSVKDDAIKKVTEVLDDAMRKAEPVLEDVKKRTKPAADMVREQADKAAKSAKKAGQGISDKMSEATAKSEVFVQYGDYEIRTEDMVRRAREAYVAEGHKSSDIREIQVYIKPSDHCAYYVINHRETGKISFDRDGEEQ